MPGYIQAALHKFQHIQSTQKEYVPHFWEWPNSGATQQFSKAYYTFKKRILRLQKNGDTVILCQSDWFDNTGRTGPNYISTN